MINITDFKRIELKIANIVDVKPHPNADKLYILTVDLGTSKKDLVAGLKEMYKLEELLGKQVVIVNNLEPAVIRGVKSEGMLLAAQDDKSISILTTDKNVAVGSSVL